ncbi:DNA polymerase-3 subunit epsilon [Inhella inkyongensis]|uniref:DNA polymerase III subunit epsilon n=1 Tax=Inhella inkyongensis TaxID=392593 RepID=A0A840SCA1_9BURK|nr:DNA polymerase III subunit epsilon [Inhella inkyongensis]MBB5206081.1 DNA polymerase-3 subunit epsilon [Inhella inkyongensis]
MRQIFFDTETTGLEAEGGDRLVEIGCVEMINRQLTGRNLHLYINPERDMPEEAFRVHGLSAQFLADKPKFAEVAEEVMNFLAGAQVVIHNAAFDIGFMNAELKRLRRPLMADVVASVLDTWQLAKELFPGKANSLNALCRRLEVDNSGRTFHGALLDAELLAEVYVRLTRGQHSLLGAEGGEAAQSSEEPLAPFDFSALALPRVAPTEAEIAAHEVTLKALDKESGGKTIWRAAQEAAKTMA